MRRMALIGVWVVMCVLATTRPAAADWECYDSGFWGRVCRGTDGSSSTGGGGGGGRVSPLLAAVVANVFPGAVAFEVACTEHAGGQCLETKMERAIAWYAILNALVPLIAVAVDEKLSVDVKPRFHAAVMAYGGGYRDLETVGGAKVLLTRKRIGLQVAAEGAKDGIDAYHTIAGHFLLRAPARKGIEGVALGFGYRHTALAGVERAGFDLTLPHQFVISRDDETEATDVALLVTPGVFFTEAGIDWRMQVGILVPVESWLAVVAEASFFSFDDASYVGFLAGLATNL